MVVITLLAPPRLAGAQDAQSGPAPADEYFGTQQESILGIRNRIADLEQNRDRDFATHPEVSVTLDQLQEEIFDWHTKYPNDVWIPKMAGHLYMLYVRANAEHSAPAMALLSLLTTSYADNVETNNVLAFIESHVPVDPDTVEAPDPTPAPRHDAIAANTDEQAFAGDEQQGEALRGEIVDWDGRPVADAYVRISTADETLSFVTNEDGQYVLPELFHYGAMVAVRVDPPPTYHLAAYYRIFNARDSDFHVIQLQPIEIPSYSHW